MTKKRKRGRPVGGQSPEVIREYWRKKQRLKRERDLLRQVQKDFGLPKEKKRKRGK